MSMNSPYQQYQQNTIMTARPEDLTLMLYNGAIKFLNQAKLQIEAKDTQSIHNSITRTEDIIMELMGSLDMKYDIAKNLYSLYDFMIHHLIQANIHKYDGGEQYIDEVLKLLKDMRDTWEQAIKLSKTNQKISS